MTIEQVYMNASEIESYMHSIQPSNISTMLSGIIMTLFLIPGIFGNIWIIYLIIYHKKFHKNLINLFIASLCLNDLINLIFVQTLVVISYIAHGWVMGEFLCALVPELSMILVGVSVWHHALISFHRYLVVVKWQFYKKVNKFVYKTLVILGTRIVPLTLSFIFFLITVTNREFQNAHKEQSFTNQIIIGITSISKFSNKQLRCLYISSEKIRIFFIMIMLLLVPCVIVFVSFTMIFIYVRRNNRLKIQKTFKTIKSSSLQNEPINQKLLEQEKKQFAREMSITRMFGVVFALFLIGFAPYVLLRTFDKSSKNLTVRQQENNLTIDLEPDGIDPVVYVIFSVNYAIASCCNPIIFGCMNRDIRGESLEYLTR